MNSYAPIQREKEDDIATKKKAKSASAKKPLKDLKAKKSVKGGIVVHERKDR